MTLDEAIAHAECLSRGTPQTACMRDHAQLAAWLRELRKLRAALTSIEAGENGRKVQRPSTPRSTHGTSGHEQTETMKGVDMIDFTKRHDAQFPIGITSTKPVQRRLTLRAAKQLRAKLSDTIEWAQQVADFEAACWRAGNEVASTERTDMKATHTNRGFAKIEVTDTHGCICSVQRSSAACIDAVWIFCNDPNDPNDPDDLHPHLDADQAREVAWALLAFADGADHKQQDADRDDARRRADQEANQCGKGQYEHYS